MPFRILQPCARAPTKAIVRRSPLQCLAKQPQGQYRARSEHRPFHGTRNLRDEKVYDLRLKSERWLHRNRPDPYKVLQAAIAECAPEVKDRYDAVILEKQIAPGEARKYAPKFKDGPLQDAILLVRPTSASLTARVMRATRLIAQYSSSRQEIDSRDKPSDSNLLRLIFNDSELAYMKRRDITLADLRAWATMLIEPRDDRAVAQLNDFMFGARTHSLHNRPQLVPVSIVRALASRKSLSSTALQTLLTCLWHVLRYRAWGHARAEQYMLIFHQFTRLSQQIWPDCMPNIASLLIAFLPDTWEGQESDTSAVQNQRRDVFVPNPIQRDKLTDAFNSAIRILAWSLGPNPYRASIFAEKAQFMILAHMVRYDPPLQVTGDAFLALAKVQLKRSRTPQEEEWAALQSRSWPPFPKPKTAIDEDKGYFFGSSRAVRTLQHMRQAGYASPVWERIAKVYAGWDADLTPTVQTRVAYLSAHSALTPMSREQYYWAAKVCTTRDVREAWALFLQYETTQLPASTMVYVQMLRKIAEENRRVMDDVSRPSEEVIISGASREVASPATSPMQRVFVSTEPPSFMGLFEHFLSLRKETKPWFRGFLLASCPSVSDGIRIWRDCEHDLNNTSLATAALCDESVENGMTDIEFRGLIELLCRNPGSTRLFEQLSSAIRAEKSSQKGTKVQNNIWNRDFYPQDVIGSLDNYAIWHAIYLVKCRGTSKPRTWHLLLRGIKRMVYEVKLMHKPPAFWFYGQIKEILMCMQALQVRPEPEFFSDLCHILDKLGRSAKLWLYRYRSTTSKSSIAAGQVVDTGSLILRMAFSELCLPTVDKAALERSTAGTNAENWIPRTANALSPLSCQYYIRALVVLSDYEGLYSFSRWLVNNEADMAASFANITRAQEKWAVVITTFRIAIESPDVFFPHAEAKGLAKKPTPELAALIRQNLESMVELGGWASDEQVEDYKEFVSMSAAMQKHKRMMKPRPNYNE